MKIENFLDKNIIINFPVWLRCLRPLAADKTGFNLKIFHFDIRGKMSIIRCDKYILSYKIVTFVKLSSV